MNSPLGRYATAVAAVVSVGLIAAYVIALLFQNTLGVSEVALNSLQDIALVAVGAVFGSAVAVNGYKAPLAAVHKRLDEAGIPPAADGEGH